MLRNNVNAFMNSNHLTGMFSDDAGEARVLSFMDHAHPAAKNWRWRVTGLPQMSTTKLPWKEAVGVCFGPGARKRSIPFSIFILTQPRVLFTSPSVAKQLRQQMMPATS